LVSHWAWPLESALGATNALYVFAHRSGNPHATARELVATIGVQVALGTALLLGSVAVLRPLMRRAGVFGWRMAPLSFLLSRRRLLPRPTCGESPMVWKECHVVRTTVLSRLAITVGVLTMAIPL